MVLKGIDQASPSIRKVSRSFKGLRSEAQVVSKQMIQAASSIKGFAGAIQAPFALSEGAMRKLRREANKLAVQVPKANKQFRVFGVTLRTLSAGIQSVIGGLVGFTILQKVASWVQDAVRSYAEFEAASVNLASVSAEAWENIGTVAAYYRAEAAAAARELGISANEALQALESLIKAGLSGSDAAQALASAIRMAKLEGVDFSTAANNLVQVMTQFGVKGSDASKVVDALVNASRLGIGTANDFAQGLANCGATARNLGLSLEDTTSWLVVLERRFGSAQEAGTHLNRFFLELYEIAEKLGVPIRDANGRLRGTNQIILDVIAAARGLSGDFKLLQDRLQGVDMRALKTLFTFTQMGESIEFLREEIGKIGVALQAYNEYLETAEGRMAKAGAEADRLKRRVGGTFADIWTAVETFGLAGIDQFMTAFSGMAAAVTGDAKAMLENWLNAQMVFHRRSGEMIADWIADWAKAGEVTLASGQKVKLTLRDAAELAEHLGVMSDKLREVLTDQARALDDFFTNLRDAGQLTRDVFEGMVAQALMTGKITKEQAEEMAEKYGFLDDKMKKVIDTFSQLNKKSQEAGEGARITSDAIDSLARKFGLTGEKIADLINQTLSLNVTYDEHAELVEEVAEALGIERDQAEKLVSALEQEAEAARKAKQEEEELKRVIDESVGSIRNAVKALLSYGQVTGPFTSYINQITGAFDKLKDKGAEIPEALSQSLEQVISIARDLDSQFVSLEERSRTLAAAQQVAATGMDYYTTIQSIQKALMIDEIQLAEKQVEAMEERLEKLRQSKDATEEEIEAAQEALRVARENLENLKQNTELTAQQAASQQRLAAIQQMLGFVSQIVSLQQTAMQLAMMGATGASEALMGVTMKLTEALEDGNITQEEMVGILKDLGVTFDETGNPVINLKKIMEDFRQAVIENKEKIEDFRSALQSLDGLTVHTYHYHHEITVKETKEAGGGGGKKEEEKPFGYAPGAQFGAWRTREGFYYLHRDEMILPKNVAELFRKGGAAASRSVVIHAPVKIEVRGSVYGEDLEELSEKISRSILRRVRMVT